MRRGGYTLVEMAVASFVGALLVAAVMGLLVSGSRLFSSGMGAARGPEAAMLVVDRLEEDVIQMLQVPGDPRPPAVISEEGTKLSFYRPDLAASRPDMLVGQPATWSLADAGGGMVHPVRDGVPLEGIFMRSWSLQLFPPDRETSLPGWYLAIEARFPADSRFGNDYVFRRVLHLPQPSANFLNYPDFGFEIEPGMVRLKPPPEGDDSFEALAPPEGDEAPDGDEVREHEEAPGA